MMEINKGFASAVAGIRRGMEGLDRNASEIASATTGEGANVAGALVDSKINKLQVEANVNVIRTMDDVLGTLFDDKA